MSINLVKSGLHSARSNRSLGRDVMYLKELSSVRLSQRDRIYIVKDLILKLVEYGALNQTALMSFCGLNMMMHKKAVTIYRPTTKGVGFCKDILEPYEKMFPRSKRP